MLEATFKVNQLVLKTNVETYKDLFREMAAAFEAFGTRCCGLCKSTNIVPVWRTVSIKNKKVEYAEFRCLDCFARLSLSFHADGGGLFVNRKLLNGVPATGPNREKGSFGDHNGWFYFKNSNPGDETETKNDSH